MSTARGQIARRRARLAALGSVLALMSCQGPQPAALPPPLEVAATPRQSPAAVAETPTTTMDRQLQVFGEILLNPSPDIDPATRTSAAAEVLAADHAESLLVLDEGLRTAHPPVLRAIVAALAESDLAQPELVDALVVALQRAPADDRGRIASIIARHDRAGLEAVAAAALDPRLDTQLRLGPIEALETFRTRAAAARLMQIVVGGRHEPPEIIEAACAGLEKLTGLDHGPDVEAWRAWWTDARHLTHEQWLSERVRRLAEQVDAAVGELRIEQMRRERVEQRLLDNYRDLFRLLPYPDGQIGRLPGMLDDELHIVRGFAIGRIERMARDAVQIPEPLQRKLAERLIDPKPELRLKAAQLLDELAFEGTARRIADRLGAERDPNVVAGFLQVLSRRPSMTTLPAILRCMEDPGLVNDAAIALWGLAAAEPIPTVDRAATGIAVKQAQLFVSTPSARNALTSLLALIGDDADIARLIPMLDGNDAEARRAVARGFSRRGLRQPLLDRVHDTELFVPAVNAIRMGNGGLADVQLVASLPVPAAHRDAWRAAVVEMAGKLDPEAVLQLDQSVRGEQAITPGLRRTILLRVAEMPADSVPPVVRAATMERLAPVLFELSESPRALELIEQVNGELATVLAPLRLEAALRCGAWEKAEAVTRDPSAWLEVLERLDHATPGARALLEAIGSRFDSDLTGPLLDRYNNVSRLIDLTSGTGGDSDDDDALTNAAPADGDRD